MAAVIFPLFCGLTALIDEEDVERLSLLRWTSQPMAKQIGRWYAASYRDGRKVYMHREILGVPKHLQVDHINRDGLDNRRANLRAASQSQNSANTKSRDTFSGYRGVYWSRNKFVSQVYSDGRTIRLGRFDDPVEAAKVRDLAARDLYGEFAVLNFPQGGV